MKKRIIALVLVVVMSVLSLASCGSFNFVKEDLSAYATFDYATFKAALEKIVLDEGDFTFTTDEEIRQAKVTKAVYEKIADAIVKASDEDDRKDDEEDYILGGGDVLYYVYYAEDAEGNKYFTSEMKETAISNSSTQADHVIKLGAIDTEDKDDDEINKLIKKNLVENAELSEYVYSMVLVDELQSEAEKKLKEEKPEATEEEIKAAKAEAIKVKAGDKIVISYTRSYKKDNNGTISTVNESAAFESVVINDTDPFLSKFIAEHSVANVGGTLEVCDKENCTEGNEKTTKEFKVTIGDVEYTYKDVKILWKVEDEGQVISSFKYTFKEDKNVTPDNCRETTAGKVNLKDKEITYYVYPVYAIEAPKGEDITAAHILEWITGSKIAKDTFDAFEDDGFVYKEEGKEDVKISELVKDIISIYAPTEEDNEFYKEGTDLQKLYKDYTDKKAISDKTGSTTAEKTATTDAQNALSDKQKELANEYIAKIAACVKGEEKATDAIVKEYREENYHNMKESYDTAITQAVQAKVWKLIQDSVKVDSSKLPEKLVKEYKKHLIDSYEYEYYKGDYSSTVSNYDKYDTFDAYLMSKEVLNLTSSDKIDEAIDAKAREYIVPIVQIYVVSKACEADALAAMPGFVEQDITEGKAYEVDEHSFEETYGDKAAEKIAEAKEQAEKNKAEAREDAKVFIIDDAFIKEYKKEIGRAYYRQLTEEYGEINLRASFQFNKLFYYLTSTNIVEGDHDGHKHAEAKYEKIDGVDFIDFRLVKYTIEEKTDNK
ncbi:MAG: hypothetical protein E7676_00525 [Ruminococcaceae bacterium]|nr:hypothetical protein [Oscillospiraceae bacterium]